LFAPNCISPLTDLGFIARESTGFVPTPEAVGEGPNATRNGKFDDVVLKIINLTSAAITL